VAEHEYHPPPMPVIVGVARSGTTLLRLMLDARRDLSIPPETGFIPALAQLHSQGEELRREVFRTITSAPTWEDCNLSADTFWGALQELAPFTTADAVRTFYRLYAERHGKRRWGDKTPLYCLHLDTIQSVLPEARFLHIIRDGRDVALSVKGLWFAPGNHVATIARDWCSRVETARRLGQRCRHYLEIRYENLVTQPVIELRRACAFLELAYDPRMERYFTGARQRLEEVKTRRNADGTIVITQGERLFIHRFTSSPPEPMRVFRWKREMSADDRAAFVEVAGPLLLSLGYEI
jgi:hypothetical protein